MLLFYNITSNVYTKVKFFGNKLDNSLKDEEILFLQDVKYDFMHEYPIYIYI